MPSVSPVPKNPKVVSPDAPSGAQYFSELQRIGHQAGLHELGVAPSGVMHRALQQLRDREERELTNGMKFTYLRPERSTNPSLLVEGARSVIVGMRSYAYDDPIVVDDGTVRARIARYAWEDHYGLLKASLTAVAAQLRRDGHRATVFADDNSIVDREIAWLAGLGWYGRNANLLVPGKGSMFVIGCVVTTADLPLGEEVPDGCGTCSRCIPACPTNAIVDAGVIDANRCLSWLLQKPGIFDAKYREALGDRIYGCDECQVVCPPTKKFGTQPAPAAVESQVNVLELLSLSDTELDTRCDRWYVHDRDMTWVRRNLLIVLGNVGQASHPHTVDTLHRYLSHERPELRAHAVWAAARLGLSHLLHMDDPHPMVVAELQNLPPLRGTL